MRRAGRAVSALTRALTCLVIGSVVCLALVVSAPGTSVAQDLPKREMNDQVFRNAKGWLVFKGDVDPGWNDKNVQIYKRLCRGCSWKLVKKTRTDGTGRWRTRIYAPRTGYWYWKGVVPRAGGYGRSVTQIYRTYVQ